MDISETNETKVMHRIIFRASNVLSVAVTMTFQNGRKLIFNQKNISISFSNKSADFKKDSVDLKKLKKYVFLHIIP